MDLIYPPNFVMILQIIMNSAPLKMKFQFFNFFKTTKKVENCLYHVKQFGLVDISPLNISGG